MGHRVQAGFDQSPISEAFALIPPVLLALVPPRFHCGVDPLYAGLHGHAANRGTAHCLYDDESLALPGSWAATIVLPPDYSRVYGDEAVGTVLHEYGHAVDSAMGFRVGFPPITEYATMNKMEAFAEAFQYWLLWPDGEWPRERLGRDASEVMGRIVGGELALCAEGT